MPTITDTPIQEAWAHCTQPRCGGNQQQQVEGVRRETAHTYRERGGDGPGVESSWVSLAFANESDRPCPHCGKTREITDQPRKTYAALSGHDPMGLLGAEKYDPRKQAEVRDELRSEGKDPEAEALRQQNEMLMERLAKLEAESDEVG